jgi:formylglycine-generating enzyme required for sulfatase activity
VSNPPNPSRPQHPVTPPPIGETGQSPGDTVDPARQEAAELELRPGARPVPDYVLVARLGEGGFGQVWKARDDNGFEVALKFLRLDGRAGATELRAAEMMRNIRHAHVLPMFRAWQVGHWLILALELGDKTLHNRLAEAERDGRAGIPRRELLEYMLEAAKGLDHLHTLSIQHRDVKPQNLLLVGGSVKVADCGLAKLMDKTLASNSGSMTVAYAAPEQFKGRISPHSDQYSLAVSYCQMRGGRLPFEGGQHQVMFGHIQGQPDLSMLPVAERPAVARALAKKPEERWPSCRAFVEALTAAARSDKSAGASAIFRTAPPPMPTTQDPAPAVGKKEHSHKTKTRHGKKKPEPEAAPKPREVAPPQPPAKRSGVRQRPQLLDCAVKSGIGPADMRRAQEAWAAFFGRPVEEAVQIAEGVWMTFVLVPPGRFRMGSPESEEGRGADEALHVVVLTAPFDLGKYPVTQAQYQALTCKEPSHFKGADDLPVENVSWEEAADFAAELTRRLAGPYEYRLPTEAEWEYACRGGRPASQPFGTGDGRTFSSREANFNGTESFGGAPKGTHLGKTSRVGSYAANALGLYDVHGNVLEWCADRYGPYPAGEVTNPTGAETGRERVMRGGGWSYLAWHCRAAQRLKYVAGLRYNNLGFRLARSLPGGGP